MTKYATAKVTIWRPARISCWIRVGRIITIPLDSPVAVLALKPERRAIKPVLPSAWWSAEFVLSATSSTSPLLDDGDDAPRLRMYLIRSAITYRSYSLVMRRRNSRDMTSRMTPIQEPANTDLEVMRHWEEMKPAYTLKAWASFHQLPFPPPNLSPPRA